MTKIAKANIPSYAVKVNDSPKVTNSKIGGDVDLAKFKFYQTPTPATDGAQKVFTLPGGDTYVAGTLVVFRDQLEMLKDTDFTETTTSTFTMTTAPDADEVLWIHYIRGT